MPNQFCPGHVDYEGGMAREFNAARAVSHHGAAVWQAAFEPYLNGANRIVDVGAGTGRFAVLIAQWFGTAVTGIEPASGMRKVAVIEGQHPIVSYVGGRAEQLPFGPNVFGAALLSNVYHHVSNRRSCAEELYRVLNPGGWVLIRGAFAGRLGEITLFNHSLKPKQYVSSFQLSTKRWRTLLFQDFSSKR